MVTFTRIWNIGTRRRLFWRDDDESGVYDYDPKTTTDDQAVSAVETMRARASKKTTKTQTQTKTDAEQDRADEQTEVDDAPKTTRRPKINKS